MQQLRDTILKELYGGLWHTTHPDRFKSILACGAILPEPDIPETERWKTSQGESHHSYVRFLGGVSLFDFEDFDPDKYSIKCPASSWAEFIPFRSSWNVAVWIEIKRDCVTSQLITGANLLTQWKSEKAYIHTLMPYIEAAHLGSLPKMAFKRAFLVGEEDNSFHPFEL
jgi:hypothetical protein